jgi:hypothetical protein
MQDGLCVYLFLQGHYQGEKHPLEALPFCLPYQQTHSPNKKTKTGHNKSSTKPKRMSTGKKGF